MPIDRSLFLLALLTLMLAACSKEAEAPAERTDTLAQRTTPRGDSARSLPPPETMPGDTITGWVVGDNGVGGVEIGQTRAEVERKLGIRLEGADTVSPCIHLRSRQIPNGVSFMFVEGKVARVDIDLPTVATEAGARVGDSVSKIESLYRGRIVVSPHKYVDGTYMTISPAGSKQTIVFETEQGRVTRYRIGRKPEVEWVEGCS